VALECTSDMIKILTHLLSYQNEKNQIMKSNVWLRLVWSDYQLQWDEADYGGIGVLRLPPDKVWKVSLPKKKERKERKKEKWGNRGTRYFFYCKLCRTKKKLFCILLCVVYYLINLPFFNSTVCSTNQTPSHLLLARYCLVQQRRW
jgi:hypothetical protein